MELHKSEEKTLPNTNVKAYKLKNNQEVYGYVELRKVDQTNPEIQVLYALGYLEEGSLYLGDEFNYLSTVESVRDLTEEEYKKFQDKIAKLEEDSKNAIEKLKKLRTL